MRIDVLTLFPEVCEPFFSASILGRSQKSGRAIIRCHNIRDFSTDSHRKVDDRPFGGGPGMVMMCQPVFDAVAAIEKTDAAAATRVLLTPHGRRFDQATARRLSEQSRLLLIAGHYEGFDERIRLGLRPTEISVGDYVLSGGEAAAMVVVDAVVRLVPGVLGDDESTREESFSAELAAGAGDSDEDEPARWLEYPQYTRPREYLGMTVPDVLLGGDHARIRAWRREQALKRTKEQRPDLLSDDGRRGSSQDRR